jgi:hypothetical protein
VRKANAGAKSRMFIFMERAILLANREKIVDYIRCMYFSFFYIHLYRMAAANHFCAHMAFMHMYRNIMATGSLNKRSINMEWIRLDSRRRRTMENGTLGRIMQIESNGEEILHCEKKVDQQ